MRRVIFEEKGGPEVLKFETPPDFVEEFSTTFTTHLSTTIGHWRAIPRLTCEPQTLPKVPSVSVIGISTPTRTGKTRRPSDVLQPSG